MSTKKDETRLRLLDAARELLVKRGFHDIGLEDIAQAAGVSRQAVYKSHFASKADLLVELVRHVHVAENLDELTRPVYAAQSGLAMLEETIRAIVKIETRLHDLAMVLSITALSDTDAAVAWRDRMEVKRGAFRAALSRLEAERRFNSAWKLDEAIDVLMTLVSVDAYQQLVVDRGWKESALIRRVWELCQASFVVPPQPPKLSSKGAVRAR
ncbi:MAG TPA: helix-turn-helix domain-containing protein [Polyangiales bacterium]|nr:helix-turn-helix domain-containing protein [Polyangiales bacterium]